MVRHVRVHRTDDAQVVCAFGHVREQLADLQPALSVPGKLERRGKGGAGLAFGLEFQRELFAVPLRQCGFRVEGVHVRGAAVGEDVNHPFGPTREVRRAGRQGGGHRGGLRAGRLPQERGQSQRAEAEAAAIQKLAAGQEVVFQRRRMEGGAHRINQGGSYPATAGRGWAGVLLFPDRSNPHQEDHRANPFR